MAHPTRIFKKADDLNDAWNAYKKDLEEQGKEWTTVQYVGVMDSEEKTT